MKQIELILIAATLFVFGGTLMDSSSAKNAGASMIVASIGLIAYALTSRYFDENK